MTETSIVLLGVNHRSAPLALRERLALTEDRVPEALRILGDQADEAYVLSTCNRTELYATCRSLEDGHDAMAGFLAAARSVAADDLRAHIYTRSEADAARPCSGSRPASTRWSSASRRSSAR